MRDTLLVVDDEEEFAAFVRRVAEGSGYEVRTTSHPAEFRQWVDEWHPSHIVLDLAMPEADGVELLRGLATQRNQAKIIVVSGFDMRVLEAARRLGIERGLNIVAALPKPIRVHELRAVLQEQRGENITFDAVRLALEREDIVAVYQPKVQIDNMRVIGFEALARWRVDGVMILPDRFVPVAEAGDVIDLLSTSMLKDAISHVRIWADSGFATHMAINLSGRNLHDEGLADRIDEMCGTIGVDRNRITLEVTETSAMTDAVRGLEILTRLRLKGFKLSIDDFGTGYSSLVQLLRLPFSEIKIDRSFVKDCHVSHEALTIVRAIVELAHNLSMTVVAEGVDDQRIIDILADLGCDIAQGYAIAKPLLSTEVPGWVEQWRQARGGVEAPHQFR